ncbi:MAG: putative toxin-antitoxin system toxin component, PIN family [Bacillati bacterium ANGP1]|uniref:Putative toxin-antitoxin system toxin component, PIN family n=2 Tax=Candidatus Segetimicrobium genomatis TaxID=2569760 RepID=A0A537JEI1_9BACT|nr:MAG: putative toxin-antitoxin system toxin component, PIN family [Terrabacteria group bacterium ANGP1]
MRVVPDTNVLVSAIVVGGPPGRLVELAAQGRLQLILSPPLIEELRGVLRRKFGFSDTAAYQAEALLRRISIVVEPAREVAVIREDPEDNRVLEAARAGDADVIVSGDRHLLSLERFGATVIRNPRELLNEIESSL